MFDIKDKSVLITGAATGIGAHIVRTLMDEDVKHISILDIDDKNGFAIEEELNSKYGTSKVKFFKCDVTQEQDLLAAFKTLKNEHGYVDVVINNAGIANDKTFVKEIEVNFTALVRSTLQAWDFMRKDAGGRGGTVINIGSIMALCSSSFIPIYSATKSAVLKFSSCLGNQSNYSRTGVRVLTVCYGVTETSIFSKDKTGSFDPVLEKIMQSGFSHLKRQTPEEAAQGLIEVYKKGRSGSVWIVTSGKPAVDVTEIYEQTNEMFNDFILN